MRDEWRDGISSPDAANFIAAHEGLWTHIARSCGLDWLECADVVNWCREKVLAYWSDDTILNFEAWSTRVARNRAKTLSKGKRRAIPTSPEILQTHPSADEDGVEVRDLVEKLEAAITKLDPIKQRLVRLVWFSSDDRHAIAEAMGVGWTPGKVKNVLSVAKAELESLLEDDESFRNIFRLLRRTSRDS